MHIHTPTHTRGKNRATDRGAKVWIFTPYHKKQAKSKEKGTSPKNRKNALKPYK